VTVFAAELLKAVTTRLLLWFGVGLIGFLALVVSIHIGTSDRFGLTTESTQRDVFQAAGLTAVVAVLVGSLLVTTEYNHGTINQSFLAVPVRMRLLAAKLGAAVAVGVVLAVAAAGVTLVLAELWYQGRGASLNLGGGTLTPLLGTFAASVFAAAAGLGLGAVLRRQTATTVVILLWLLIGENVIALIPGAARYAPGHVLAALVVAHRHGSADALGFGAAALVAAVYAAVLCAAGFAVVAGSDVPSTGD
jgi:ABC-type transport system involved in multi-copper enzyme maturation permease subunit